MKATPKTKTGIFSPRGEVTSLDAIDRVRPRQLAHERRVVDRVATPRPDLAARGQVGIRATGKVDSVVGKWIVDNEARRQRGAGFISDYHPAGLGRGGRR